MQSHSACRGHFIHRHARVQLTLAEFCWWHVCVCVCVSLSIWSRSLSFAFYIPWNTITCPIILHWIASLMLSQKCVKTFKLEYSSFSLVHGHYHEWGCSSFFKFVTLFTFFLFCLFSRCLCDFFNVNTHISFSISPLFLYITKNPCNKFINSSELYSRSKPVSFLLMAISFWPLSNSLSVSL